MGDIAEEEIRIFCSNKSKYRDYTYQYQGFYISKKMDEKESNFVWDWEILGYDEKNDVNYVHSDWYERIHNWDEHGAVRINDEVLYWMPLHENLKRCENNEEL